MRHTHLTQRGLSQAALQALRKLMEREALSEDDRVALKELQSLLRSAAQHDGETQPDDPDIVWILSFFNYERNRRIFPGPKPGRASVWLTAVADNLETYEDLSLLVRTHDLLCWLMYAPRPS